MSLKIDRFGACVALATLVFALPQQVHAQGAKQPSASAKDTARTLLVDCRSKFGKNDFDGALKSCQGAHSIMSVPTTGLDLAKVQQAMGLLVEARETALEAVRFDNSTNNAAFAQAQTEANQIAQDLEKRIPSLVLSVSGIPLNTNVRVLVDADEVPTAAMSLPFRVNPGERKVTASAEGFGQTKRTIKVTEGQTVPVELDLSVGSDQGADKPSGGGRKIPVWAWAVGGVGVLGVGAGVYFGIEFKDTQDTVSRDCPNNECKPSYSDAKAQALQSQWNRNLTLTIVSSTVGAACLGAALYGIVTAPKKDATTARVVPWIGRDVGGAMFIGAF